jgi:serine/threonine protein kinase
MGEVYRAHDERLEREVAIKVLHSSDEADVRLRLFREARAAAAVNHPTVCQIYEIGEADEQLFMPMEPGPSSGRSRLE